MDTYGTYRVINQKLEHSNGIRDRWNHAAPYWQNSLLWFTRNLAKMTIKNKITAYYAKRASEYERIYQKPERRNSTGIGKYRIQGIGLLLAG